MITKKDLHEIEMQLVFMLEEGTLTREHIIDVFTNLMSEVN